MPYVTLQSDWQDLADKAFKAINGDKGGTWAPSSPIVVNSSGLVVTGPTKVNYGGRILSTAGSRFLLGDNEWPKLGPNHPGRKRVIRSPMVTRLGTHYHFAESPDYVGSLQTMALTTHQTFVKAMPLDQPQCHIPLRVHDGARLVSVDVHFRVPLPRAKAPFRMPRFRVLRADKDGKLDSLRAPSATVDVDGWSSLPRVTSGDAWYAGGAAQSFTFTCDQNHTIDTSQWVYYLEICEEVGTIDTSLETTACDGTVVRERKRDVVYVFETSIPYSGNPMPLPPPDDLFVLATGDRVLIVAGGSAPGLPATQNGIWIVNLGGPWTRAADCSIPSDFTSGFMVFDTRRGCFWECVSPTYGQTIKLTAATGSLANATEINFRRRVPRGNVWHAIVCSFDTILDMRPQ